MNTVKEFMQEIVDYFGSVPNDKVKSLYILELRYVKPSDFDRLFRQLIIDQPQAFCPDYKALIDAIKKSNIVQLDEAGRDTTKCPVCGMMQYTNGCCPFCKYDSFHDGSADEYRAFWEDWKKNGSRYDITPIFQRILSKKRVESAELQHVPDF